MKPKIQIVTDAEALYRAAATEFMRRAREAVEAKGSFTVVLSGGSTPKGFYSLLVDDATFRNQIPWDRIYFFWGDERPVPPDHIESNYRMANEVMLSKVPVPPTHIHRIRGENPDAGKAAEEYEQVLRDFFQLSAEQLPRFDLVFLGLGSDAHTASLFPCTRALQEQKRLVVSNWVGKLYTNRVTLTVPVLNRAACVIFLVSGDEKALPLKAVLEGRYEPQQLPAQLIRPDPGELLWLVDHAAARLLQGDESCS
ncbi:MAG TPA: 6-phosphogluconolactonase [Candidatus Limnocylindrales bacterium]|nr:6-phosphogluconolactonase [Candidatus Limnocylindrales bacterium]